MKWKGAIEVISYSCKSDSIHFGKRVRNQVDMSTFRNELIPISGVWIGLTF